MVKKITVNCSFSGANQPVTFYIGDSALEKNPIGFQSKWLSEVKGGSVPPKLMDSLVKIKKISDEHSIPFEDLYDYVVKEIESGKTLEDISVENKQKAKSIQDQESMEVKKERSTGNHKEDEEEDDEDDEDEDEDEDDVNENRKEQ